jgi:hypothetical protein
MPGTTLKIPNILEKPQPIADNYAVGSLISHFPLGFADFGCEQRPRMSTETQF